MLPTDVDLPEQLPVLPVRSTVVFPGAVIPLDVGRRSSVALVTALGDGGTLAVFTQKDATVEDPKPEDLHAFGCAAKVLKLLKHTSGNYSVILQGLCRVRIRSVTTDGAYLVAVVEKLPDVGTDSDETRALDSKLRELAKQVITLMPELPMEAGVLIDAMKSPSALADLVAATLDTTTAEKVDLLAEPDVTKRLGRLIPLLTRQRDTLKARPRSGS
jgi:ATP-dependent Lon protease